MEMTSNGEALQNGNGRTHDEPLKKPEKPASWFQRRLGFVKRYNYRLWLTLTIIIVLFSTVHLPFINPETMAKYKAAPGEVYWYRQKRYRYGMVAHLAGVLPAGMLAPFQFIPALRRPKWIAYHRYIGYLIVTLLAFAGIPGAATIVNHSFGGTLDTQLSGFVFGSAVYTALALGLYNIWKLQLDQHRKWMLRAMVWMSLIVTSRICLMILIISLPKGAYQTVWTCDEARFTEQNATVFDIMFPQCRTLPPDAQVIANAYFFSEVHSLVEIASALRVAFGASVWMAICFHTLGTEVYLALTKDETERLRRISYTLQQKAGFKNPGSAGLTADRLGDSSWIPPLKSVVE